MKMTDSENSQAQDDSDEDIYKDIPEFNFEDELAKLEGSKETYKQEAIDLSEKVNALTEENKELKKSNEVLKKNLSTLLKTAQAEVQRKDLMIEELRSKVELFTFRRNKKCTRDKITSTDDLNINLEVTQEFNKPKSESEKEISKFYENRTSSDSERRFNQEEERKKVSQSGKEENSNCDNDRKPSYNRENTNFRYSEINRDIQNERRKERKSTQYEDNSGRRIPFRENHRDHLLYDSFDKKRHSRSSDSRFLSRRKNSRERRCARRRSDSCERRKRSHNRDESSERSRRRGSRKERSRSRGSKESSLEKPKSRSSSDKDPLSKMKEGMGAKPEVQKGGTDGIVNKKRNERCEEEGFVVSGRDKQNKEKGGSKNDKRRNLEMYNAKSPLDALYNDMVTSRSFNRFANAKSGATRSESDLEEGELSKTVNECQEVSESQAEDWTLSFKNERRNETKPMTLYSKRMMQRLSEVKEEETLKKSKEEKGKGKDDEQASERKSKEKIKETEKEPGELTDDESVIESSKEFQELTKVAAIESEIIAKECSKEAPASVNSKIEPISIDSSQKELEAITGGKEEPKASTDESNKEIRDVIEFSPFKNNYKLIEISPTKPAVSEHVLDFYNKKPTVGRAEPTAGDFSEEKAGSKETATKPSDTSDEKDSWKNLSWQTDFETVAPLVSETTEESEIKTEKMAAGPKESMKKKGEKKVKVFKEEEINLGRGKRRSNSLKEPENLVTEEKGQKRKRKSTETEGGNPESKKPKLEKSEPSRKNTRRKRNSKSESEKKQVQETEATPAPQQENKMKEDISSFEFFKPIARAETMESSATTDYKMTATMSLTGVVRLETPNKCVGKLKNLMINEQMIFNVLDTKNHSHFSPLTGSKSIEMTPRRLLKNDLMLTDSEDDSINKQNVEKENGEKGEEEKGAEEEKDVFGSEYSECDSDSGASDFVDLL